MTAETISEKVEKTKKGIWKKLFFLAAGLGLRYFIKNITGKIREKREEKEKNAALV